MTHDDFTAALARTRMQGHGRPATAAYRVLCQGASGNEAAKEVGITPPGVSRAVKLIRAAALRPDLPPISAPSMSMEQFKAATKLTKMSHTGKCIAACKLVLVDGWQQKLAGAELQVDAPSVSRGCRRIVLAANLAACPVCGHQLR